MADCYYHGQSGPGSCPECITEDRRGLEQGSIATSEFVAKNQMAHIDANRAIGVDPSGKRLRKKKS